MTTPPSPQYPPYPTGGPGSQDGYGQPGAAPGYGAPTGPAMSVGDGLAWAWSRLTANPLVLFVGILVWTILSGIGVSGEMTVNGETYSIGFDLGLGGGLLSLVARLFGGIALANVSLKTAAGQKVTWGDLVSFPNLGAGLLAGVLSALATGLGFVLLVVPGIILLYLLYFSVYVTTDRGVDGIEGMRASMRILSNNAGHLLPFALAGFGLCALGFLTVIGWVVAIPLVQLMTAYAYVRVQGHDVAR